MLYAIPIASANFTVQKQKHISQCRIQSEDLKQTSRPPIFSHTASKGRSLNLSSHYGVCVLD